MVLITETEQILVFGLKANDHLKLGRIKYFALRFTFFTFLLSKREITLMEYMNYTLI